jgi:aldehyde:ferredoxin oxidoreductase
MEQIVGTSNRVLEVDLNTQTSSVYMVSDHERKQFIGAKGLGLKLLWDRLQPGIDPLGPDNIIAFMPGVLMGTGGPCSGRFEAITKSPLTGIMITSSCGGPFGMSLKTAGWDGLIIKGRAESPQFLEINKDGVRFEDATHLWGKEIPESQSELDDQKIKSVVIGPAGENLVRYANMASGHRFLGRGGVGAVMGSKNLKAIRAHGGAFRIKPKNPDLFKKTRSKAMAYIKKNPHTSDKYRNYGTASNVKPCVEANILPVHNFRDGRHELADQVSGEVMAEKHKTTHHTCKPCSIQCGHQGIFNNEKMAAPEYETIGLLGTSLGIFDLDTIAHFNQICGRLGIDTISAGGTLAWVMEATEQGLIETDLAFGKPDGIEEALHSIARMEGFGEKMARGTKSLSEAFGGTDFAMHVKGLEMAAYDPRGSFGQGLAYAVANRGGCHLSAYLIGQEIYFKLLKPNSDFGKAKWVKYFEDLTCCINSLQTCQFTMFAFLLEPPLAKYTPDAILGMLMHFLPDIAIPLIDFSIYTDLWQSVTGISVSDSEFLQAGERIHVLERLMNTKEGINRFDDTLPGRLMNQTRESDNTDDAITLDKMIQRYYKVRGFDSDGLVKEETLARLGLT